VYRGAGGSQGNLPGFPGISGAEVSTAWPSNAGRPTRRLGVDVAGLALARGRDRDDGIDRAAWGAPGRGCLHRPSASIPGVKPAPVNYPTWDYRAYYGLPESARDVSPIGVAFIVVLGLFMLAVGLLAYGQQRRRTA